MPIRPCLDCGEYEMHYPPTSATVPSESLVAPCPLCEGPRDSHDFLDLFDERTGETKRFTRLCHSCRSPKPGTLGAAFVLLMTDAASTKPLSSLGVGPVADVRDLSLQYFRANDFTRRIWDQLVRLLKSRGKRSKRLRNAKTGQSMMLELAYAISVSEVIEILREEIQARCETPVVEAFSKTWATQHAVPKGKPASIDDEPEAIPLEDCSVSVVLKSQEAARAGPPMNDLILPAAVTTPAPSKEGGKDKTPKNRPAEARRESVKALIEALIETGTWGLLRKDLAKAAARGAKPMSLSSHYRLMAHPDIEPAWKKYQAESQGKVPTRLEDLEDLSAFSFLSRNRERE